jgi:biotin carboxylase
MPIMYVVIVEPRLAMHRYLEIARQQCDTIVVTHDTEHCLRAEADYRREAGLPEGTEIDRIVECDTKDPRAVLAAIEPFRGEVCAVLPADEPVVSVSAAIARGLGLPGPDPDDAVCQHIKTHMKRRFQEHGVPTPDFRIATELDQALAAWKELGGNAIIKMVDYESSVNVFHARSEADVRDAWTKIMTNDVGVQSALPLRREVLVEQPVFGRELSVEGYVRGDEIVILNSCEKITAKNFQVIGHNLPSLLSDDEREELFGVARKAVRALRVRDSVFHLEAHIHDGKAYVIECASRPPGHHVCTLLERMYDFDFMEVSLRLARGEQCDVQPSPPKKHFAIYVLYTLKTGTLKEIVGLDELEKRGGLEWLEVKVKPGDLVEELRSPKQRYGVVLLSGATPEEVRGRASWMLENVRLVVDEAKVE